MKFELPSELASIIKVIGVGGGGSNAVNHMHAQGIQGVDFIICNTDRQALDISPIAVKLQIGSALTKGLGAGSIPERGKSAAQENLEEIRQLLSTRTEMVFITAGMGGGTGTGAAPVIARIAREMGLLTVGIVTMPFKFEGHKRVKQANEGIEEMRQAVDTLIVINNDRLRELFGNLTMDDAFAHADNVLATAARGIADIITVTGKVNVDFEDVRTVMSNSGVAIMGMAEAEGEDRAQRAALEALASPLLNDNDIRGAKYVLLNVAHGEKTLAMDEMSEITEHIQEAAGSSADVIFGYCQDKSLGDRLRVTVIATGFNLNSNGTPMEEPTPARKVIPLGDDAMPVTSPMTSPLGTPTTNTAPMPASAPSVLEPYLKKEPVVAPTVADPRQAPIPFEPEVSAATPVPTRPAVVEPPAETPRVEKVKHDLYAEAGPVERSVAEVPSSPVAQAPMNTREPRISPADHSNRVEDRLARVREMSILLRSPNGLSDMEREPAYRRKNVVLRDAPHSTDSSVSRYTLNEETDENGERRVELRRNNPFLHDNVD
jgi:cell division protein FtsZ